MTDTLDTQIAIWNVSGDHPTRMMRGRVDYEKKLEEWIERDPTLIQRDLTIVGRQIRFPTGRLDLLGLDSLGRWVVMELKRGEINRDAVIQAIDYASCIVDLTPEALANHADSYLRQHGSNLETVLQTYGLGDEIFDDKEINILVVGTGRDQNLERLLRDTSFKGKPITAVTFEVLENEAGERLLIRKLTEFDNTPMPLSKPAQQAANDEVARLMTLADEYGMGEGFRKIYDAATRHGLYPRTHKWSIMYTPPAHKGRCLVVAWVYPKFKKLRAYAIPETFAEYYPIGDQEAADILGSGEQRLLAPDEVGPFIERLDTLFAAIARNS